MSVPTPETHVKVLFHIEEDDGTCEVESLWAIPTQGGYRIDNIPFFARDVAWGDLVAANPIEGGVVYAGLMMASGHSTIRMLIRDADHVQRIRDELRQMQCSSELFRTHLVAVDIPPEVPYLTVQRYLEMQERAGVLEYEEGCLGQAAT